MKIKTINKIALSVLSVAVLGLIAYSLAAHRSLTEYRENEALAQEAVFEGLVSSAEKLNSEMIKLCVSRDEDKICDLLSDVWRDSAETAAQIDLTVLETEDKLNLESFINVVGDYAHALEQKIRNEGEISAEDRGQIEMISDELEQITEKLRYARENGYVASMEINAFFDERQQHFSAEEYPRLLYDGPFSESTRNREPAGIPGYDVTEQKALRTAERFAGCTLSPVAHTDGDVLPFYHFENEAGDVRVSVTKQGGAVLYYKNARETDGLSVLPTQKRANEVERAAKDFLRERGYGACAAGQRSYYNGMAVLEMVPQTDEGVLLFPDLIRVWIDLQSGEVMGLDAENYLMNHTERQFEETILSEEEAESRLSEGLQIREHMLAVIPNDDGSESYCHGFFCEEDGRELLIFLDAQTGKERDILLVLQKAAYELTL